MYLKEEDLDDDFESDEQLAYEHCSAHNLNLVIGDGINALDETFTDFLNKVTKDIVGKSKMSSIIAEELRKFYKNFVKNALLGGTLIYLLQIK